MEEDEEYEMLEVQEEEDGGGQPGHHSGESGSEAESPNKSSQSYSTSPEKQEEQKQTSKNVSKPQTTPSTSSSPGSENIRPNTGAKLLNSMATVTTTKPNVPTTPTSVTAAALQKKGITMKKTSGVSPANQQGRSIIKTQQGREQHREHK